MLPVGGIKSKILAAHRSGIRRVILPRRNEKDLLEIPSSVRVSSPSILSFRQKTKEYLSIVVDNSDLPYT